MFVFVAMLCLTLTSHRQADVFAKVEELFKDAPDLSSAFRDFLPGAGSAPDSDSLGMLRGPSMRTGTLSGEGRAQKRKQPAEPAPASTSAPAKRRRKAADRDKEKDRDAGRASGSRVSVCLLVYLRLPEMINLPTSLNNILLVASRRSPISAPSPHHHHRADQDTPTHTRHRPRPHRKTSHSKVQPLPHLLHPSHPRLILTRPNSSHA